MPHRPLWTWRTVDARVHTDRYEHGERSVWDDFLMGLPILLNAFARFSSWFQTTITLIPAYHCLSFSEQEDGKVVMSKIHILSFIDDEKDIILSFMDDKGTDKSVVVYNQFREFWCKHEHLFISKRIRPQSRTGAYVHRPPNDNINWGLENRVQKRGHKKRRCFISPPWRL